VGPKRSIDDPQQRQEEFLINPFHQKNWSETDLIDSFRPKERTFYLLFVLRVYRVSSGHFDWILRIRACKTKQKNAGPRGSVSPKMQKCADGKAMIYNLQETIISIHY
jgi:hypothetical protein